MPLNGSLYPLRMKHKYMQASKRSDTRTKRAGWANNILITPPIQLAINHFGLRETF